MVDLFSMFRRRPAKRGRPGFARQDITALGDNVGGLVAMMDRQRVDPERLGVDRGVNRKQNERDGQAAAAPEPRIKSQG